MYTRYKAENWGTEAHSRVAGRCRAIVLCWLVFHAYITELVDSTASTLKTFCLDQDNPARLNTLSSVRFLLLRQPVLL